MAIRVCLAAAAGLLVVTAAAAAPGNGRLAYVRDHSVFVSAADGSGEKEIANGPFSLNGDTRPIWSADGSHVAYLAQVLSPGVLDVVPAVAGPDGESPMQLAEHGSFRLVCWLDSSTVVAVDSYEVSTNPATVSDDLYAFGLDGSTHRLTVDGGTKWVSAQACAPDGSAVAYTKPQSDYTRKATVVRRDGAPPTVLTPAGFSDDAPSWSPGGNQLAFARSGANPGLYVSDPTGAGLRRLTSRPAQVIRWSPDATEILFTSVHTDYTRCSRYGCQTASQIRSVAADGSRERLLAAEGEGEDWSPDGRRVAFSLGLRSLVMNPDGSCKTLLPANVPPLFAWQPDFGQSPAVELACADLSVSSDMQQLDLPLRGQGAYTLTVSNKGNREASAVSLDQAAAAGVTVTAVRPSQGACTADGGIHCSLGAIAVGGDAQIMVNLAVGSPSNTVLLPQVSAPEPDRYPFDSSTRVGLTVFDCSILGTYGADSLVGTPGRDHICGRFDNDTIHGNAGNDVIEGGEGADMIYGGRGRDRIFGGGGNDVIFARDGARDVIDCGPEADSAIVDRFDAVSHCRTVYRPPRKPQARAPR